MADMIDVRLKLMAARQKALEAELATLRHHVTHIAEALATTNLGLAASVAEALNADHEARKAMRETVDQGPGTQ